MTELDFELLYSIRGNQHHGYFPLNCMEDATLNTVIDANYDDIKEFIIDRFQSVYEDVMSQGHASMNFNGIYIYDEVYDAIYDSAYKYLEDHAGEIEMVIIDPRNGESVALNVSDYLRKDIIQRTECEACLVDVSEAISYDSIDFVENGIWQADIIESIPTLWFGKKGVMPMRRWMITPDISTEDYSFWFSESDEDMLEAIVDNFAEIGTWYLYECGFDVPELSVIIDRCPVKFEKDDTPEIIRKKITESFSAEKGIRGLGYESDQRHKTTLRANS